MKRIMIDIGIAVITTLILKHVLDKHDTERATDNGCPYLIEKEGENKNVYFSP